MTSPQEAFSKTVAAFLESTDNEERNRAEQWLLEWEKDINSLPLALENENAKESIAFIEKKIHVM